ncbi:MAG: hypothetical protein WBG46_05105 [Nonlabens sp.]
MTGTVSKKVLDSYVTILSGLDDRARDYIMKKLAKIKDRPDEKKDFSRFYGAWEDDRTSDEIIKEIRDSRVEKDPFDLFE